MIKKIRFYFHRPGSTEENMCVVTAECPTPETTQREIREGQTGRLMRFRMPTDEVMIGDQVKKIPLALYPAQERTTQIRIEGLDEDEDEQWSARWDYHLSREQGFPRVIAHSQVRKIYSPEGGLQEFTPELIEEMQEETWEKLGPASTHQVTSPLSSLQGELILVPTGNPETLEPLMCLMDRYYSLQQINLWIQEDHLGWDETTPYAPTPVRLKGQEVPKFLEEHQLPSWEPEASEEYLYVGEAVAPEVKAPWMDDEQVATGSVVFPGWILMYSGEQVRAIQNTIEVLRRMKATEQDEILKIIQQFKAEQEGKETDPKSKDSSEKIDQNNSEEGDVVVEADVMVEAEVNDDPEGDSLPLQA